MKVLFVPANMSTNDLNRAHRLWLLTRALGWDSRVVGSGSGGVWEPLAKHEFADDCLACSPEDLDRELARATHWADLIIPIKPLPDSMGRASRAAKLAKRPVLVDIDDPALEIRLNPTPLHQGLNYRLRAPLRIIRWAPRLHSWRRQTKKYPRIVSNPELQRIYGGVLVPHVDEPLRAPSTHKSTKPNIAFIGTNRAHKGIGVLREAGRMLADDGFTITITDEEPPDAQPWERWVGNTTADVSKQLLYDCDICAVPSLPSGYSSLQLPSKLIDAMVAGRAVVASDFPPIRWALGDEAFLTVPGDSHALASACRRFQDPTVRGALAGRLHRRALSMFTPETVAPKFAGVVRRVVEGPPAPS